MSKTLNNLIFIVHIIITSSVIVFGVEGAWKLSLSDIVANRVTLKTTKAWGLSEFGNPKNFGNLYTLATQEIERTEVVVFQKSLQETTNTFNGYYKCSMTTDEIITLLDDVPSFRINARWLIPDGLEQSLDQARNNFVSACTKAYACISWNPFNAESSKTYTVQSRDCSRVVHNTYQTTQLRLSASAALQQSSRGDEIFQDGTLDNSPYDLLLDIKNIGDVMFQVNKEPTPISAGLFFAFPELSWKPGTNPWNNPNAWNISLTPWWNSIEIPNQNDQWQEIWNSIWTTSLGILGWNNTSWKGESTPGWNTLDKGIGQAISQLQELNSWPSDYEESNGAVMNEKACLAPSENIQPSLSINEAIALLKDKSKAIDQQNDTIDATNAINNQQTIDGITPSTSGPGGWLGDSDLESLDSQVGELVDSMVKIGWEYPDPRVESCLATCNENYKPGQFSNLQDKYRVSQDLAICTAKCLCSTVSSPDLAPYPAPNSGQYIIPKGTFQLRLCMVPGQWKDIARKTKVASIQDILVQINDVLRKLIESGQLMKHTKTKEFLDSSQKKNSFGKMFSFQLSTTFKTLPNDPNPKTVASDLKNYNTNLEEQLLGFGSTIDTDNSEKYLLISDSTQSQSSQENANTIADIQENADMAQAKSELKKFADMSAKSSQLISQASQANYVGLSTELRNFLEKNSAFWVQMNDTLNTLNAVTANFKNKIKKAQ